MNQKELKELIEFLIEKDIAEFELERGDVKVRIKRAAEPGAHPRTDTHYFAVHAAQPAAPQVGTVPVAGAPGVPSVPVPPPAAAPAPADCRAAIQAVQAAHGGRKGPGRAVIASAIAACYGQLPAGSGD